MKNAIAAKHRETSLPWEGLVKKKMIFMAEFTDYIFYHLFWFTFTRQRFLGEAKRFAILVKTIEKIKMRTENKQGPLFVKLSKHYHSEIRWMIY